MVILIGGSSHAGKTHLSQKMLEKYNYPYISIDHIKMGLIRSGMINLSVYEDEALTDAMWPMICEMIKTMVENGQNAIIEGCYIPYDWKNSFDEDYLEDIEGVYLVMSSGYIEKHYTEIRRYASIIEKRGEDDDCTMEHLLEDNAQCLYACKQYGCNYILIEDEYNVEKIMEEIEKVIWTFPVGDGHAS